jgi:hypothetical protein
MQRPGAALDDAAAALDSFEVLTGKHLAETGYPCRCSPLTLLHQAKKLLLLILVLPIHRIGLTLAFTAGAALPASDAVFAAPMSSSSELS